MPTENLPKPPAAAVAAPVKDVASFEKNNADRMQTLREKVQVLRDGVLFDRGKISNPDPNKQYCWVNIREDRQIMYQALGWELVRDPNLKTKYWKPDEKCHRRADLILYEIDRELFLAHQAYNMIRGLDLTGEAADEAFAARVKPLGVRPVKPQ